MPVKKIFIVLDVIFSLFIVYWLVVLTLNIPNFGYNPVGNTIAWGFGLFMAWRLVLLSMGLIKGKYNQRR